MIDGYTADELEIELDRIDAAESLVKFVRLAWHIIEPGAEYVHGWHIDFLCEHLEAITNGVELEEGQFYNRLLINVPPGAMKSLLTSVFWPAWWWGPKNEPHKRFLCASHSQALAIRDSTKMRRLIQSEWYQARWGDRVTLTGDQNAKTKFETTAMGFREAVAAGSITGSRGDVVIIDDPHSVEGAASDAMRQSTIEWFLEAVPTRLNNPQKSAIVVIMQRLHEEDVSGVIIDKDLGYDHIMLPMRYDPGRAKTTLLGYEDPREEEGELLFPARFPEDVVDRDERVMGPYACTPGEAPVLMADLSLKRIDEVREGDEVLGWVRDKGGRSRMVRTRVRQAFQYHGSVVKMTLNSGETIRCTPDHKWWRARWEKGRNEYAPAKVGTSLARVCPSSLPELSQSDLRLAGWLSGFFDGEGTVSVCKKNGSKEYRPSQQIHFYQGSGRNLPLCEKLEQALTHFGFPFRYQEDERKPNKDAPCYGYRTYNLISGQQSLGLAQKFMHIVQPTKWRNRIEDMALGAKFVQGWEKVVSIEPDGQEPVYALETETGNYVVWGLCSSNSAGQFQQSPEPRGGGIIRREWWQTWERDGYPQFDYVVAALDTAYTTKAENDPSAMTVWGIWSGGDQTAQITRAPTSDGEMMAVLRRTYKDEHPKCMLMYAWSERLELHDLVERVRETMDRYGVDKLLVENKAAGHSVAQELRRVYGYEDFGVQMVDPKTLDKMARLYSVQHLFAEGLIYAPRRQWAEAVINQSAQFPKAKHDDLCLVAGTMIAMADGSCRAIEDIRIGDLVATPSGAAVVSAAGKTFAAARTWRVLFDGGEIEGTGSHPVMSDGKWTPLSCLPVGGMLERLHPNKEQSSWRSKAMEALWSKVFSSMDTNTTDTQSQKTRLIDDILRAPVIAFIEMFGSITTGRSLRATRSTMSMATPQTTTLQTLNACPENGIGKSMPPRMQSGAGLRSKSLTSPLFAHRPPNGIEARRGASGIRSTLKEHCAARERPSLTPKAAIKALANGAARLLRRVLPAKLFAAINARAPNPNICLVRSVSPTNILRPVYNMTVDGAHCYYANGVLVHNCDTLSMAMRHLRDTGLIVRGAEWTAKIDDDRLFKGNADEPLYPI